MLRPVEGVEGEQREMEKGWCMANASECRWRREMGERKGEKNER